MMKHNSNIKEFNTSVNTKLSSYYANKHIQFDAQVLLEQILEAYRNVADTKLHKYMMRQNDEHNEGLNILTPEELMGFAFKKYQTWKQKKVWKEKLQEEQSILNLMAKFKKSNAKFKQVATKKPFTSKRPSNKSGTRGFGDKHKECYEKAPGWMKKNSQDRPKTMKKDGYDGSRKGTIAKIFQLWEMIL
jgi:hypothetical protein